MTIQQKDEDDTVFPQFSSLPNINQKSNKREAQLKTEDNPVDQVRSRSWTLPSGWGADKQQKSKKTTTGITEKLNYKRKLTDASFLQ